MNEQEKPQQPNLYENIDFERRYLSLAAVVLKKYGSQNPDETEPMAEPHEAIWPKKPEGYHYRLQKFTESAAFYSRVTYLLEHYIDELPKNHPVARYIITLEPFNLSAVNQIDIKGHRVHSDLQSRKEAARQAMSILAAAAPLEAEEILNDMVNRRFEILVGAYVLSGLAVRAESEETDAETETAAETEPDTEGKEPEDTEVTKPIKTIKLSEEEANDALVYHLLHDLEIQEEEGAESVLHDPEAKQIAIDEAINEAPMRSRRRGDYRLIDIITIVKQTANQLQRGWKNTVKPDQ